MSTVSVITAEQFMKMDLDGPYELIRGELVQMATPDVIHGFVCATIGFLLTTWSTNEKTGRVGSNDGAIQTEFDPDTVRGADVYYFSYNRLPQKSTKRGVQDVPPNLAVEVLSPSNRWSEIRRKVDEYLMVGVDEVWVVNSDDRTVKVFCRSLEPVIYRPSDEITSSILPGFTARVADFFQNI